MVTAVVVVVMCCVCGWIVCIIICSRAGKKRKKTRIHSGPRNYNANDCITQGGSCVSVKNEIKTNLKIKQQEKKSEMEKGHLVANASLSSARSRIPRRT